MKLIDLTQTIAPDMPVYPGTEAPTFSPGCALETDGFLERKIAFFSHTGTHIDAPAHLIANGKTLDRMPIETFFGQAVRLDCRQASGAVIDIADLEPLRGELAEADFLLLHTGWSRYWGTAAYFADYPVLSKAAAHWLTAFNLKGVGVDAISVDSADTERFPVHKGLLEKDILLVENLANLERISHRCFTFFCMPLKLADADGAPVRAGAIIPDSVIT